MSVLDYTHADGVATIVLNNPPQNRFAGGLTPGLLTAIGDLAGRTDTRVVLLKANGPDFSHGGNVAGWLDQSADEFARGISQGVAKLNQLEELPAPVVVAVQGYCGGGGFELALRGDIIVAAENAEFCHSEATISAFTFMGGVQRVAERVGRTRALQWAITAECVDARAALEAGLVNEVVPLPELDWAAASWVDQLRDSATLSHAAHKRLLRAWSAGGVRAADGLLGDMAGRILYSEDAQSCLPAAAEAIEANRQRPRFKFSGR